MDYEAYLKKQERIKKVTLSLEKEKIAIENKEKISLKDFLKKPEVRYKNVLEYKKFKISLTDEEIRHIESEIKYEGYLKKQEKEISRIKKIDGEKIPGNTDYKEIPGLTREVIEKLEKTRPKTIRDAKNIPGLTPAAIVNLHIYLNIQKKVQSRK